MVNKFDVEGISVKKLQSAPGEDFSMGGIQITSGSNASTPSQPTIAPAIGPAGP